MTAPIDVLDPIDLIDTDAESYRAHLTGALTKGWRFAGTYVTADRARVRTLLVAANGSTRIVSTTVTAGQAPTVTDLAPAAGWDEREASDLHGIHFTGHTPLRPLVNHTDPTPWTVPVHGDDPYQIAVGPIHAGVIESGHFRFHVVGDRILHLDARLFYKHRGLEKAAEGKTLDQGIRYVARVCAACTVTNTTAYAHACEQALGLVPSPELARTRTILLELERVWNHLNDVAAICAGTGLAAGNTHFAALTDRARHLNAALTGHRFLFHTVRIAGSDVFASGQRVRAARTELTALHEQATSGWRELEFNPTFQDRLPGIGILTAADARRLGTLGPAARAAGLARDARTTSPRLCYNGFQAAVPERATGDVKARFDQRALELRQSFDLLDHLLDHALTPAAAHPGTEPHPIGIGRVESPRGATTCVVERDLGRHINRLHLRTGSYANWPSVVHAATDNLLPDFPLINKSFELCYACADR
jgi:Ni,Fe-hydrogenase III large subunit